MVQYLLIKCVHSFTLLFGILRFQIPKCWVLSFITILLFTLNARAARLAIVIDDFGYRVHNENKILQMPAAISIAVLPDSPYGRKMAQKAHKQGREVLIHLPMAPISKQSLEKNTLHPSMSNEEVEDIIHDAIKKVPHAIGINNHMGSAMTSNLAGMKKVMNALSQYRLYFLDSVTIGNTQVAKASMGTPVQVLRRNIFLDDVQTEAEALRQLNRAITLARKQGSAIAIGHPYPTTIRALQRGLATLPDDIELVTPSMLLNHSLTSKQSNSQISPLTKQKCIKSPETKPVTGLESKLDYFRMVGETLVPRLIVDGLEKLQDPTLKQEKLHSAGHLRPQKDKTMENKTDAHKEISVCPDF
ncbi:divergent polysaccharide deacetylase family protein [Xenorhabdus budapestensis]|uniref:divergent polysaccharide deacetylase family protein n=1 Tax=Xenorhabdus budapestensis TaxID=290110 RepID=UPI000C046E6B|nr:divergent polysaccharide deacetylase family protein [Xenorhabdus budapestensis]